MSIWRARVVIENTTLGGNGVNTWHVRPPLTELFDATQMDTLMGYLATFYSAIKNEHRAGTSWHFDGLMVRADGESGDIEEITPWDVASTTSQGGLPPANCVVVGWRTANASRSGKGRSFFGPIGTNALDTDGTVDATTLGVFRNAADDLIDAFSGGLDGAFGVWSREDSVLRDFTANVVHDKFAILRSRRD